MPIVRSEMKACLSCKPLTGHLGASARDMRQSSVDALIRPTAQRPGGSSRAVHARAPNEPRAVPVVAAVPRHFVVLDALCDAVRVDHVVTALRLEPWVCEHARDVAVLVSALVPPSRVQHENPDDAPGIGRA
jgi:hypothetical protein